MTSKQYAAERRKRGTQEEVAKLLGVDRTTIAKRETGGVINEEAKRALLSLPLKPSKP